MIYPSILTRVYESQRSSIEETARRVKSTLSVFCEEKGYAFISRIKAIESVAEKIETGRFKVWSQLDDLFACTIIIPTLHHEEEVIQNCQSIFAVKEIKRRGSDEKSPDIFRFDATRISAALRRPEGLDTVNTTIYDILFEIQIRTAFEHAWVVTTHDLVYKNPEVDWKRQRLAAQLKAIVEQLDMLILGYDQVMGGIVENSYYEIRRKQMIAQRFAQFFSDDLIPAELMPKDLSRFCNNIYSLLKGIDKEDKIEDILTVIEKTIKGVGIHSIPRSLSLFQYIFVILVENEYIRKQPKKFTCHITDEMETLFPVIKNLKLQETFKYTE